MGSVTGKMENDNADTEHIDCDEKLCISSRIETDHALPHSQHQLSESIVPAVEGQLDIYERYSLVFLLFDNADVALQTVLQPNKMTFKNSWPTSDSALFRAGRQCNTTESVLLDWVRSNQGDRWQEKLEEALCIVQNYHVLHLFGKQKSSLETDYLPQQVHFSCKVDITRKCLFLMSDDLSIVEWEKLSKLMNDELIRKNPSISNLLGRLPNIPEVHMLLWMSQGLMQCQRNKRVDFSVLINNLKRLSFLTWVDRISSLAENINNQFSPAAPHSTSTVQTAENLTSAYPWNPERPGVILIFNHEKFNRADLDARKGTKVDQHRLEETFELLKFDVRSENDLPAKRVEQVIKKSIEAFPDDASCFVVAFLSHGEEGTVHAKDAPLEVKNIRRAIQQPKLAGIPKIILIQACQGHSSLVTEGENVKVQEKAETDYGNFVIETDGPGSVIADTFTFTACVQGFEAYRSPSIGSFFIQEVCNEILLHGHEKSFEVLATNITGKLEGTSLWMGSRTVHMVPESGSTLTKALYLSVPEENREAAKKNVEKRKLLESNYLSKSKNEVSSRVQLKQAKEVRNSDCQHQNISCPSTTTSCEGNESTINPVEPGQSLLDQIKESVRKMKSDT